MGGGSGDSGDDAASSAAAGGAEGKYTTAKTSVWWDYENCHVPRGFDAHNIAQNISSALAAMGYTGPVTISAYGDTNKIPDQVQQAINSTGVSLNHVPAGVKDASDKKILVDMLFWAVDNPPPANYLLISGDRDFSNALHQLRMRKYNILLAQPQAVSQALVAAAKSVWNWTSLVAGGSPLPQPPETCKSSISDSVKVSQQSDSLGKGPTMIRSNNNSNGRSDNNRYKGKVVRKVPNQQNISIPRFPSTGQLASGSQACHSSGMLSSMVATEGAHANTGGNSSILQSPHKPPNVSTYPQLSAANQFNDAPHHFLQGNMPHKTSGPIYSPSCPDNPDNNGISPMSNGKFSSNNRSTESMKPLRPSDLLTPQPNFQQKRNLSTVNSLNQSSCPPPSRPSGMPYTSLPTGLASSTLTPHTRPSIRSLSLQHARSGPPFTPPPPANLPDIDRLDISGYPNGVCHNAPPFHHGQMQPGNLHYAPPLYHNFQRPQSTPDMDRNMSNNGIWGTQGGMTPPPEVLRDMGNFFRALSTLKNEKIPPTEAYISDCIRYGDMNLPDFNVGVVLDCAIKYQYVVVHKLGDNLPHFTGKNESLWRCVNIQDCNDKKHPKGTWEAIQQYLSSSDGRFELLSSQCRYQAAILLRKACLKNLVLGDILQILHVMINVKKWIVPHPTGWQPLSFFVPPASPSGTNRKS